MVAGVCYAAVSPHTLPFKEYNAKFYFNLQLAFLCVMLPPLVLYGWTVVDKSHNDIHDLVHGMFVSFAAGYGWIFALEIIWTTILRIGVFALWEPHLFVPITTPEGLAATTAATTVAAAASTTAASTSTATDIITQPSILLLPWVLREHKLRLKRITLLMADFITSCVACPIVEEFCKLRLLQWTIPLAR
jgi:hypothetical protein